MTEPALDAAQAAAARQFDQQSQRYGRSHILADTTDIAAALSGVKPAGGARALDVATGGGHTALWLARQGWSVTVGDVAPRMLAAAQALLADAGFAAEARLFPAERMPFEDATFDVVASRVAPHHFSSPADFVQEAKRVLRPGGQFLLIDGSVPDDDPETAGWLHRVEKWRDSTHGRFLSRREWEELVRSAGLIIQQSELHPMQQPDPEWYFETAATPPADRQHVREAVQSASPHVRKAMQLSEVDGKIGWRWQRLTLVAARPQR